MALLQHSQTLGLGFIDTTRETQEVWKWNCYIESIASLRISVLHKIMNRRSLKMKTSQFGLLTKKVQKPIEGV